MDVMRDVFGNPALYVGPAVFVGILAVLLFMWHRGTLREDAALEVAVRSYGLPRSVHEKVWGGKSDNYFDSDLFLGKPDNIGEVLKWFEVVVREETRRRGRIDRLAFIEKREGPVGAVGLRDLFSWKTNIPTLTLRARRRGPAFRVKGLNGVELRQPLGTGPKGIKSLVVEGRGERVLVVSDVGTTGTTIANEVRRIRELGGVVDVATVLYDRLEGAKERLAGEGVQLIAMFKAKERDAVISDIPGAEAAHA